MQSEGVPGALGLQARGLPAGSHTAWEPKGGQGRDFTSWTAPDFQ